MYAKLVVGNSNITALAAIRDIGRLITSNNPTLSLLGGYSQSSSVIIDNTPAGWSYVGSVTAADRPTIASTGTSTAQVADVDYNLCFSAPCLNSNTLKYCALTIAYRSDVLGNSFCLTGASSATSLGVLTNEGPRVYELKASATNNAEVASQAILCLTGSPVIHVIANPRHITIIIENTGIVAVWESSQTDAHTFYGTAPFVQYCHYTSSVLGRLASITPVAVTSVQTPFGWNAAVFNVTSPNTGINYGTYDLTEGATLNIGHFAQTVAGLRANTLSANGLLAYTISPVYYSISTKGYPSQVVTGVVPIYYIGADIGTTGDQVEVNGQTYTFFNAGINLGVILQTS
jgi:hypothetical protein